MIFTVPTCQIQSWYPELLSFQTNYCLKKGNKKFTGLGSLIIQKWTLVIVVWPITSYSYVIFRVFHNKLPRMSQTHEYMALDQISNHPRINLVGEIDKTLMYFNVL